MANNRTVTQSHAYTEAYKSLARRYDRLHDIQEAIDWLASCDTSKLPAVPGRPELRFIFTVPFVPGVPAFRVLLRVDGDGRPELLGIAPTSESAS